AGGGGAVWFAILRNPELPDPSVQITNETFTGNSSGNGSGGGGGGGALPSGTVRAQQVQGEGGGAILFDADMPDLVIQTLTLHGNPPPAGNRGRVGFGIAPPPSTGISRRVTIENAQFVGNTALSNGGGLYTDQNMQGLVITGAALTPNGCAATTATPFTPPTC